MKCTSSWDENHCAFRNLNEKWNEKATGNEIMKDLNIFKHKNCGNPFQILMPANCHILHYTVFN